MRIVDVVVTAEDIAQGKENLTTEDISEIGLIIHRCPVALALQRALDDPTAWAGVTMLGLGLGKGQINTPTIASQWISSFDNNRSGDALPFSFQIQVPA